MPAVVLVVDDEPAIRDAIALLLEDEGYRVLTARNGDEALGLLAAPPPTDVVVSDVMMPLVGGHALVRAMRARGDATPVILISAAAPPLDGVPGVTHMRKPFDLDALLAAVADALRG